MQYNPRKGQAPQHEGSVKAGSTVKVFQFIKVSEAAGVKTVEPYPTAGEVPDGIATYMAEVGRGVDTDYAAGEQVKYHALVPGTEMWVRVPANSPAIAYGDPIQVAAGGGAVKTTTGKTIARARGAAPLNAAQDQFLVVEIVAPSF